MQEYIDTLLMGYLLREPRGLFCGIGDCHQRVDDIAIYKKHVAFHHSAEMPKIIKRAEALRKERVKISDISPFYDTATREFVIIADNPKVKEKILRALNAVSA